MGQFKFKIEELAEGHLKKHFKSGNKSNINKIERSLLELTETPYSCVGNLEALRHDLTGFWSRRINSKDRLIYFIK